MQLNAPRLRKVLALAGAGAATIVLGASASAANAASLDVHYVCDYPLISKNGLQVHIDANIPSTANVGELTPAFDIVATTTTEGNTYAGISLTGTTTVDGSAVSKTNVTMPDGSVLPLNVPVTIDHYVVPPTAPLTLVARGTAPQLLFSEPGTAKIDVSDIDLHLLLKKSDGTPVGAALGNGPGSVDDGDPNTNDVKCVIDPAGQNTTLQTITVQDVDNPPSIPGQPSFSSITQTSADVSWAASTDDKGVAGYEVYVDGNKVADTTTASASLTGLNPSTTYSVTVKAKDTAGQLSDASPAGSLTTSAPADTPPTAPGTPDVTNVTASSADVSWAASTDDHGVDHYEIYLNGTKAADASGTSASLTGLTANTAYSLTVKAVDTAGQSSDASAATSFTTGDDGKSRLDAHYVCDYPLISKNGLQVHIEADVPLTATVGEATPTFDIVATTTTEGNTYAGISLTGTTTVDGTAVSETNVTMPDGSVLPLNVPVTIDHYVVPPTAPLTLVARGTSPSLTFSQAGTAKIDISDIDLHLLLKKSDGTPVGAALGNGPGSVDDGDPNTNDVKCVIDPAGQNTTLATIDVAPAPVDNPPTAPGQPSFSNVTETSADVSWAASTDDHGVDHYEVYVDGSKVAEASGTSASLSGLSASTTYTVVVKAVDTAGQSSEASPAGTLITATPPDNPPTAPGKPDVTNVTETSADVSWAASTDDHAVVSYDVIVDGTTVQTVAGTSATLTGLTAGTSYSVTIVATDDAGQSSEASAATSFTTVAHDNPPTAPGQPSFSNVTETSADVSWTASTDDHGVDHYEVYVDGSKVAEASGTSASLSGLSASTTYTVVVKAVDTAGQVSDASPAGSLTTATPVDNPPTAPGKPDVTNVTETSADVSWAASTDDHAVVSYDVIVDGTTVQTVAGTSATLTGLTAGMSYSVTVVATDDAGQSSEASAATSFTTVAHDNPPTAPGTPDVTNVTENSADVSWAASTDDHGVDHYDVYLGANKVAEVTSTSAALTGLTQNATYSVTVVAVDSAGQSSEPSAATSFTTVAHDNPPTAPGQPSFSNVTETSADVSWAASTDDHGVDHYEVYLDGTKVAEASGTSASLSGLSASTTYTVVVKAVDTAGQVSDASPAGSLTTATPVDNAPTKPGTPDVTNVTENSADVSWAASTDDHGVDHYDVYLDGTKVAEASGTSASLTGLSPATTYAVTVKAIDTADQASDASDATSFTTKPAPDNAPTKPGTPDVTTITDSSADVSWAASTDDHGVDHYEVYLDGTKVAEASGTSTSLTGLSPATTYSVTVKAIDTVGNGSDPSEATSFTTKPAPDTTAPSAPGTPTGTSTETSISVSWAASTDNVGVTGYDVFLDGSKKASVTGTSATINGLTPDTEYKVKVQARDDAGNTSAFSGVLTIRTKPSGQEQPVPFSFAAKGSTYIRGGYGSAPLNGSINAQFLLSAGTFTADLSMDPTTANLRILGFLPVTAKLVFVPVGQTTGSLKSGVLKSHSSMTIKIPSSKLLGWIPIAGGNRCQTSRPVDINLSSDPKKVFNPLNGGDVSGIYTLPALQDCGPLTSILSYLTAMPGNTINLKLTPKA